MPWVSASLDRTGLSAGRAAAQFFLVKDDGDHSNTSIQHL